MKKNRVIGVCAAILLVVLAVGFVYAKNMPIISMHRSVVDGEPVANGSGLVIDTAKDVTVSYSSDIKAGNLTIRFTDEDWNTIKEFKSGEKEKERIHIDKGNYYVRVESDFFQGNYDIKVYE